MSKKVNSLKDLIKVFNKDTYNKPNTFGEEGEDHINISISSTTGLGRFLDPGHGAYFKWDGLGSFRSPLNLVYWLRDKDNDDRIRYLKRKDLNVLIRAKDFPKLDCHQAVLLHALAIKLKERPDLIDAIKALPDDIMILSYKVNSKSKIRITTGYANIIIPVVKELFDAVKSDRPINYRLFIKKGEELPFGMKAIELVGKKKTKNKLDKDKVDQLGELEGLTTVIVEEDDEVVTITPDGISYGKERIPTEVDRLLEDQKPH